MLIDGYTPYWLYRILPVIYGVAGVGVIAVIGNGWAIFSGLLLISAAVAIIYMRSHHRAEQEALMAQESARPTQTEAEAIEVAAETPVAAVEATAPPQRSVALSAYVLSWDAAYDTDHEVIDRQHRKLFDTCNALIRAATTNRPRTELDPLLDRLVTEVEQHFRTEEAVLGDEISDEALAQHHRTHEELAHQATHLVNEFRHGRMACSDMVSFLVSDLVALHVISETRLMHVR